MPTMLRRARALLADRSGRSRAATGAPDGDGEADLRDLTARVAHLEAALEGLQDAVYRQSQLWDEQAAELLRRTAPDHIAQQLSEDARRRGL